MSKNRASGGAPQAGEAKVYFTISVCSYPRHPDRERTRGTGAVPTLYRYLCGIYHFFYSFWKWYGSAKCGMVLV